MAESSSHNPSSPKITPKEEPVTLDKPESPNPFLPADQIEFTFEEIAFTTNNEVALLYPSHPNSEYFREVSTPTCGIRGDIGYSGEIRAKETLKKSCLPPRWRLLMNQTIQCLGGKTGGLDQISNKDATILYCLANEVKVDYARLIWKDIIHKLSKKTREKVVPYPSVHNWALKPNQTEGPPITDHMKAICNLDVPVDSKTPKPSSHTKEVPQGKKPGAKSGLRRKQSSKHTSESKTKASKSKTGQSEKETQSTGGPTSLGATSEDGTHPQLSSGHDASADSTAEVDPRLSAPNDSIPSQQDQTKSAGDGLKTVQTDSCTNEESRADKISKKIKLKDLLDLLKDIRSVFFTPDSPQDEPIIVSDESEEEEKDELEQQKAKAKAEVALLKARPSFPDINQLTNLLVTSLNPELSKLLASHNFASCLLTELKELPSKFTELSGEIKELKQHVKDMEIKLPGDLKEIPTKLETFTSTISSLTSQVAELKNIQWELPAEFATVVENASGATTKDVPSVGQATASPAEGEKNTTKDAETNLQNDLVDLLGIDVVETRVIRS
ncbi:hypothetical protein Tco_1098522 [Tanacetum coccineum]